MQPALLRAVQFGEIRPVGSDAVRQVSVRILAATHRDLASDARQGRFREDLYYRLNTVQITVPPLRERIGDIPALSRHLYGSQTEPAPHDSISGLEHFDKVISVDQAPIGRTPRSNPATYTGLFTPIRELFAEVPTARERGYGAGRFSFNVAGGRCESCQGDGVLKVEMHFLPDVYVTCDVCAGRRFMKETLEVRYKKKNIHDVLEMTVEEAITFFEDIPPVYDRIKTLHDLLWRHHAQPEAGLYVTHNGAAVTSPMPTSTPV